MVSRANIAATNMEHLCNCSAHGYSWDERWGNASRGTCYVECEGHTSIFYKGDRDCSSAVIDSWQEALIGSDYEGCLAGATYTGNMVPVFTGSGLFEWHDMSFVAQRGDIYLNIANHTAMCTCPDPDLLGEFSANEFGGCYGGQPGDQTGWESHISGYYSYPWDGILHYNGKADGEDSGERPDPVPPTPVQEDTDDYIIWLQAHSRNSGVLPTVSNASDDAGDGSPIEFLSAWTNVGTLDVQAYTEANGWLDLLHNPNNIYDEETGSVGDGSPITKIKMYYWSPNNDMSVYYRAMVNGEWLPWMKDDVDLGGSSDDFAGDGVNPIQRVEAYIGKY